MDETVPATFHRTKGAAPTQFAKVKPPTIEEPKAHKTRTVYLLGLGATFIGMALTVIAAILIFLYHQGEDRLPDFLIGIGGSLLLVGLAVVF